MTDTITNTPLTNSLPETSAKRIPPYTVYKANGRCTGGAISFSLNRSKGAIFVEAANQSGEKSFDWENKIIMKWGLADIGSILAGLQGKQPHIKLFHKSENANSACSLNHQEVPNQPPFLINISRQNLIDKQVRKVAISLTEAEAVVLEAALRTAISRILGW